MYLREEDIILFIRFGLWGISLIICLLALLNRLMLNRSPRRRTKNSVTMIQVWPTRFDGFRIDPAVK